MLDVEKMRLRRLELRLSQKALGEAIRQDQAYISRVENTIITDVTAETLGRIARVLKIPMEQLLILDTAEVDGPQGKQPRPRRKAVAKSKPKASAPK
jgi:transcriptional regulator with XRE-family HTH domain